MSIKTTTSIIIVILVLAVSIGVSLIHKGEQQKAVEAVRTDIEALNDHDWSTFLAIRTSRDAPENRNGWIKLIEVYPRADIMENVISAELVGIKSIPLGLAKPGKEFMIVRGHTVSYIEGLKAYYVAVNYRVKEENQSIYNGVNYRVYILTQEDDGQWTIGQISEAVVRDIREAGYGFNTLEEETALWIQNERERTGRFLNPEGEIITHH